MSQVTRVPLDDICAGPKCRFFQLINFKSLGPQYAPTIISFYDKSEMKEARIRHSRKERHGFSEREVEYYETEPTLSYHVIYEMFDWPPDSGPFCTFFQSSIAPPAFKPEAKDYWYARDNWLLAYDDPLKSGPSNQHLFYPIEEMAQHTPSLPEWHDGKCPSFVLYPVKEIMASINDDEFIQEESKRLVRAMLKTREVDELNPEAARYFLGAENMLYYLMEEPEKMQKFLKMVRYARGEK